MLYSCSEGFPVVFPIVLHHMFRAVISNIMFTIVFSAHFFVSMLSCWIYSPVPNECFISMIFKGNLFPREFCHGYKCFGCPQISDRFTGSGDQLWGTRKVIAMRVAALRYLITLEATNRLIGWLNCMLAIVKYTEPCDHGRRHRRPDIERPVVVCTKLTHDKRSKLFENVHNVLIIGSA